MSLADISIKRPVFISCIVFLMVIMGYIGLNRLGVELFPDVSFPIITVRTLYPGAGPSEVETLVSKIIEDELSGIAGLNRLKSQNTDGLSVIVAEFVMSSDIKDVEQQIRDRISSVKIKLPKEIEPSVIQRIDPSDQSILTYAVTSSLPPGELYDLMHEVIKPKLEQVSQVGKVEILGVRKREIQVYLQQRKLKDRELSVSSVAERLLATGENIPAGNIEKDNLSILYRTMGAFKTLDAIASSLISFYGNENPTLLSDIGRVENGLEDEKSRAYFNGKPAGFIEVYRQSKSNTLEVVRGVKAKVAKIQQSIKGMKGSAEISLVRDAGRWIDYNVEDVKESIVLGVILAVVVVFLFLANGRSTIITGLALPNSLLGAFVLMYVAGYTVNIMTLLALSLAVGLLIDDAIVVRENIFRHLEMGKKPEDAAREGTSEVSLAVVATTLAVIAVFGPMAFLKGTVGQFFKQFGMTICFAMLISLFDALTIAPMLSAYFAGRSHHSEHKGVWYYSVGYILRGFSRFQDALEIGYEKTLKLIVARPKLFLLGSLVVAGGGFVSVKDVTKTFLPAQDNGEFMVSFEMPPGSNLSATQAIAFKIDEVLRKNKLVEFTALTVGDVSGRYDIGSIYVQMVGSHQRNISTSLFKQQIRSELEPFAIANPLVKDFDPIGGGKRPFEITLIGDNQQELDKATDILMQEFKAHYPELVGLDTTNKPPKKEVQFYLKPHQTEQVGALSKVVGSELRSMIQGVVVGKFREYGKEYDIRVRLAPEERDIYVALAETKVPNLNMTLVRLTDVADTKVINDVSKINRYNRSRMVSISSELAPKAGIGDVLKRFQDGVPKLQLPASVQFDFLGDAELYQELAQSMLLAMGLGVLFIYLVLCSLYESFVTPFTIMLALPLALCGSFFALYVTHESINLFSMIGMIMLLGVASKNSILLVDYANQLVEQGVSLQEAIVRAGKTRLRPIFMTTMALIAGVIPIALGLNEASRQRVSMGIAIIGGLISSTLLTLLVIPAVYTGVEQFRRWSGAIAKRLFMVS